MSKNRKHQNSKQAVIDICILEAGRFDMLSKCLDALYREAQTTPISIYILDNACNTKELQANQELLQYNPEKDLAKGVVDFKVKHSQNNIGFPAGNMEIFRMGRSSLVMFLNDDVELKEGAISQIVADMKDPTLGVVGIKLLFPLNSSHPNRPAGKVQHCGMAVNIRGEPIHPLVGWSTDNPKTCESRDVWAVTGACFTVRRQQFSRLGGFDTVYGMGTYEDTDYCMKVRQSGGRVFLDAKAQGYHCTGATAEKLQAGFPLQQNANIFRSRWQNSGQIFWNEWEWW